MKLTCEARATLHELLTMPWGVNDEVDVLPNGDVAVYTTTPEDTKRVLNDVLRCNAAPEGFVFDQGVYVSTLATGQQVRVYFAKGAM